MNSTLIVTVHLKGAADVYFLREFARHFYT